MPSREPPMFEDFLEGLDAQWTRIEDPPIALKVIGSTALFLHTDYERRTKDSDILRTSEIDDEIHDKLLRIAGKGTPLHQKHRIFLDIVGANVPMLPSEPIWHPYTGVRLRNFTVSYLDVVDVLVSKLKRFHGDDQDDIQAMIEKEEVTHEQFLKRFRLTVECYRHRARVDRLPEMAERFNFIEQNLFIIDESTDFSDVRDMVP